MPEASEVSVAAAAGRIAVRKTYKRDIRGAFASSIMGGGHAVMYDSATGMKYGASSPRKDGAAIPEPEPIFGSSRKK